MTAGTDRLESFRRIVRASHELLELARQGEWEAVAEGQRQRQKEVEAFFAEPVPAEISEDVEQGIHEILTVDREVMTLGEAAREEVGEAIQSLGQRRKAQNAYAQGY